MTLFCPSASDLTVAYGGGSVQLNDGGWSLHGGGGAASKAAFNLLGGYVEYDVDFTNVKPGVNFNFYTISPGGIGGGGFIKDNNYCDGAEAAQTHCMELDFIEGAGNCGLAATIHTKDGGAGDGCTAWGCRTEILFNGKLSFRMKVSFGTDGSMEWNVGGRTFPSSAMQPRPDGQAMGRIMGDLAGKGGVLYSSMWGQGDGCWTPMENQCGKCQDLVHGSASLDSSKGTVSNLKVMGAVVQGPTPRACGDAVVTEETQTVVTV